MKPPGVRVTPLTGSLAAVTVITSGTALMNHVTFQVPVAPSQMAAAPMVAGSMLVCAVTAVCTVPAPPVPSVLARGGVEPVDTVGRGVVDPFGRAGRGMPPSPGVTLCLGTLSAVTPLALPTPADPPAEARAGPLVVNAPAALLPASVDDTNVTATASTTTRTDLSRIVGITIPRYPNLITYCQRLVGPHCLRYPAASEVGRAASCGVVSC